MVLYLTVHTFEAYIPGILSMILFLRSSEGDALQQVVRSHTLSE